MIHRWEKIFRFITDIQCLIGMILLVLLMLIGTVDVLGRYFFDSPVKGAYEYSEILLAGVVFFGLAYALSVDGHVKIDTVISKFKPKVKVVISMIMASIALLTFILISWQGTLLAYKSWTSYRQIDVIHLPIAPFQLLVPLGCLAVCLELILQIVVLSRELRKEK